MPAFKPIAFGSKFGDWTTLNCLPGSAVMCSCKCGAIQPVQKHTLLKGTSTRCKKCAHANRHPISHEIKAKRLIQRRQDFWLRVDRSSGPDSCWSWLGPTFAKGGYGQCPPIGGTTVAHKVAWILTHSAVQNNLKVCHTCDNPICCNPSHLWLGTPKQNSEDMVKKGRSLKGVDCPVAVLNPPIVRKIMRLYTFGLEGKHIALKLKLNRCTVRDVLNGRTWSHITNVL